MKINKNKLISLFIYGNKCAKYYFLVKIIGTIIGKAKKKNSNNFLLLL